MRFRAISRVYSTLHTHLYGWYQESLYMSGIVPWYPFLHYRSWSIVRSPVLVFGRSRALYNCHSAGGLRNHPIFRVFESVQLSLHRPVYSPVFPFHHALDGLLRIGPLFPAFSKNTRAVFLTHYFRKISDLVSHPSLLSSHESPNLIQSQGNSWGLVSQIL